MSINSRASVSILIIALMVLAGISQSLWWTGPGTVQQDGLTWTAITLSLAIVLLTGLLFQAERLLAAVYLPSQVQRSTHAKLFQILVCSMLFGSLLLGSHNLLVQSWQSNINYSLFIKEDTFSSFALLIANQQKVLGGLTNQLLWLVFGTVGTMLTAYVLGSRILFAWLLVSVAIASLAGFAWLFQQQLMPNPVTHVAVETSYKIMPGIRLVLDTSLAGFGIIIAVHRWRGHAAKPGWLVAMLVLLALVYLVQLLGAWEFAGHTWINDTVTSDRLLLHIPYALLQMDSPMLPYLWLVVTCLLSWIKVSLLLVLGALIIAQISGASFALSQMVAVALTGILALCWLVSGELIATSDVATFTAIFKLLVEDLLDWWYPLHILLLCLTALGISHQYHATFVWQGNAWLGRLLQLSYAGMALLLVWHLYQLATIR